jgi:hypothetical protein
VETNYSVSQRRKKATKQKVIQISNRWIKTATTLAQITSPSDNPNKARFNFGVKEAPFLFGTVRRASHVKK